MEKRMGRPPSTFKIRGLSEVETETLLQHALKRGVKVEALLRQVVTTVLHDNLVDAVLDDRVTTVRRSRRQLTSAVTI
jgi:hypothetical protein